MKKIAILAAIFGLAGCAQPQDEQNLPENVMVTGTNPIFNTQFAADPTARVFKHSLSLVRIILTQAFKAFCELVKLYQT